MASRRMFHIDKIQTDALLSLAPSAQCLFFHCMLTADDDGFLARPLAVVRMAGCSREDLDTLIREGFLMLFPSGVVLVKHWRIHNCIRHDRYHASILPERDLIGWDKKGEYFLLQERQGLTTYGELEAQPQETNHQQEETAQEALPSVEVTETPAEEPVAEAATETVQESTPLPEIDPKQLIAPVKDPSEEVRKEPDLEQEKQSEMVGSPLGSQWEPEVRLGKARPDYAKQGKTTTLLSVDPTPVWCVARASTDSGKNDVLPDGRTVNPGALQVLQQAFPHMRYTVLPGEKEA